MKTFISQLLVSSFFALLLLTACQDDQAAKQDTAASDADSTNKASTTAPSNPTDSSTATKVESVYPGDEKDSVTYCFIKKFYAKDGRQYLDADFIQFYVGDKAVEVARKYKEAQMEIKNGDTVYYMLDDIYIRNDNKLIRSLVIADNASYKVVGNEPDRVMVVPATREQMLKSFSKDKIYVLSIDKDNIVTQVKEQYTP